MYLSEEVTPCTCFCSHINSNWYHCIIVEYFSYYLLPLPSVKKKCIKVMGYEASMSLLLTAAILCRFIKQSFKDIPGIDHGAASDVMYAVLFICRLLMISKDRLGGSTPEWRRLSGQSSALTWHDRERKHHKIRIFNYYNDFKLHYGYPNTK